MVTCTRCDGTGFLNVWQVDRNIADAGPEAVQRWIHENALHEVQVCDCCGDGDQTWHGEPGQHYGPSDPSGKAGPYAYNGGLCECH